MHLINFYRIVGVPNFFINKQIELKIENFKSLLPFDFYEVDHVCTDKNIRIEPSISIKDFDYTIKNKPIKFMIQSGNLVVNFESGIVKFFYQAIPLDDQQEPLVIENSNFSRAFIDYVTVLNYRRLFDMGKINGHVYQNAKQEYAWSVGSCETEFQRLNLQTIKNFHNVITSNSSGDPFNLS